MMKEIQTFVQICDGGTFAAAAEQLGITQSAVSAQIRTLEKHLGYPLFDRNRRGAILSEQGEQSLPLARQMVNLFAKMTALPQQQAHSGSLNIGLLPALQNAVLAKLLPLLPETPRIHTAQYIDLLKGLQEKHWDIAILVRPNTPLPAEFAAYTLSHDPCFLLMKGDVQYQNILSYSPVLAYESSAFGNDNLAQFFRQQGCRDPIFSSDDANTLISLIKNGMGVGILPQSCLKHSDLSGLARVPVAVSRELVVVSLQENAALAENLANAYTAPERAATWRKQNDSPAVNFGLRRAARLSAYYRA